MLYEEAGSLNAPYWHSTHIRANVVGFLISSPRLLLIRKRVCAWVPTRPSVRFSSAAVRAKASRSSARAPRTLISSWLASLIRARRMRFDSRMRGDDDAEISTHYLIFSAKKLRTDLIVFMLRLGFKLNSGRKKTRIVFEQSSLKEPPKVKENKF